MKGKLLAAALLALLTAAMNGASAQPQCRLQVATDAQGTRVVNKDGHWIYVTPLGSVSWARISFPEGIAPVYASEFDPGWLKKNFAQCGDMIAPLLLAFLSAEVHSFQREANGALKPGQVVPIRLNPSQMPLGHLITTGSHHLLDLGGALYGIDADLRHVCGITPFGKAGEHACTAETRQRLSGIVRRIAEQFAEIGVSKVQWPSGYYFRNGRLRAQFQVTAKGGDQLLRFEE